MKKLCQLVGIFPRSPGLVRATRDFDRGRCSEDDLEWIRREDARRLVEYQKDFEYITDGALLWQDLLRPFTIAKGIEEGALTRFFKTNTFYRKPIINDIIVYKPELIERFLYLDLIPERMKVSLPGPISFLYLSEDRYKINTPYVVAEILAGVSKHLENRGVASIEFLEPGITSTTDLETWEKVYEIITDDLKVETSIHTYFTDFSMITDVIKFPVKGIGIDFIATSIDDLEGNIKKKIGIGYINAQNSLLEDTEEVVEFAKKVVERLGLKEFYLCPNCDLSFLPYSIALKKLEVLEKAAERVGR